MCGETSPNLWGLSNKEIRESGDSLFFLLLLSARRKRPGEMLWW